MKRVFVEAVALGILTVKDTVAAVGQDLTAVHKKINQSENMTTRADTDRTNKNMRFQFAERIRQLGKQSNVSLPMNGIAAVVVLATALMAVGAQADGTIIPVPSDRTARYFDRGSVGMPNGLVQIHTERHGSSGRSHAVRIIDCRNFRFAYIYDADKAPILSLPLRVTMPPVAPLVRGSISYWVTAYACRKHR